jgi:hypothetical protein
MLMRMRAEQAVQQQLKEKVSIQLLPKNMLNSYYPGCFPYREKTSE